MRTDTSWNVNLGTHQRRRLRLPSYDYSRQGAYFLTICVAEREPILGHVKAGAVVLSPAGEAVLAAWQTLPSRIRGMSIDEFVVMPDHVHGILWLTEAGSVSLPRVVRAFKSIAAIQVNAVLGGPGSRVWQRSYYERVIRNERELNAARRYIENNPLAWSIRAQSR